VSYVKEIKKDEARPDWDRECPNCGMSPVVPFSKLCGPCTFGMAATMYGNWWDDKKDDWNEEIDW